jgi:transcriptional regulator with XRE-family HTH domain
VLDDDLKRIASRIRAWRDEAGMTLQQLGDQSGVSASTIHKIENLQTVPTIAVLLKVANGLDRRPSELFAEAEVGKQVSVLRVADRQELTIEGRAKLEHLAPMIPRNRLDVWRVDLEPNIGAGIDGEAWQFQGEIILLVEEGELELDIAGEGYKVGVGDSIHFDTSLPHRWYASGGQPVRAVAFALLPERLQGDLMSRIAMSSGIASAISTRSQES